MLDIFRYALKQNEISERVFRLTSAVVLYNQGNYTAWYVRYKCIEQVEELKGKLDEELEYLNEIATEVHKIYQYWHYRKLIVKKYGKLPPNEYETLDAVYEDDATNYHMWTYRVWVTGHYKTWDAECEDVAGKLEASPKNNSLWSYRQYLIFSRKKYADVAKSEVAFAQRHIARDGKNESAWFYYKGILLHSPGKAVEDKKEVLALAETLKEEARKFSEGILSADKQNRFAMTLLVDICKEKAETTSNAIALCSQLAEVDKIRNKYWNWQKHKLQASLQPKV